MHQSHLFPAPVRGRASVTPDDGVAGNRLSSTSGSNPHQSTPRFLKQSSRRRIVSTLFAIEFIVAIMVRIFIGVLVLVLPWSPLWDSNPLLKAYPHLAQFLSFGATRGVLSGIGLLNLWVAVDDTLHRGDRHS